jgi:hypothetical protein
MTPGLLALPHFQCYELDRRPFTPIRDVSLIDQFGDGTVDVRRPKRICNPANKRNEDPSAPSLPDHLVSYEIRKTGARFERVRDVRVTNQFGTIDVDLRRPSRLLVPSAKSLTSPAPPLGPTILDHYQCYDLGRARTRVADVSVVDQFGTLSVDVKRPQSLCVAADKNGEGIQDPAAHLLCYQVKTTPQRTDFHGPIFIDNQFGAGEFAFTRPTELCLPSTIQMP